MPEVTARGIRFHVQTWPGDGPVVVFLHGLVIDNLSSFYYTLAAPVAEAGAHCVLYDQRGHGRTERTPTGYTVHDAVADLIAVLDALGHHRVYLVANSFGGAIALTAALLHPDRVAGLALIEAHGPADIPGWHEDLLNTLSKSALTLEYERTADQLRASDLSKGSARRVHRRLGRIAATADALINGTTLLEDLTAAEPVRPAALATLTCPVLAIYGQHSDLATAGRLLLHHVPGCTLHTMPGYAHTVLQEGTAEILEVLLPWLAHHTSTQLPATSLAGNGAPNLRDSQSTPPPSAPPTPRSKTRSPSLTGGDPARPPNGQSTPSPSAPPTLRSEIRSTSLAGNGDPHLPDGLSDLSPSAPPVLGSDCRSASLVGGGAARLPGGLSGVSSSGSLVLGSGSRAGVVR